MLAREASKLPAIQAIWLFDQEPKRAGGLAETLPKTREAKIFKEALREVDLVVEAASQEAVAAYGPTVIGSGKDMMILSVGALADAKLESTLNALSATCGGRLYIPSGALAGLDALKSASVGELREVHLRTRKPPASLGLTGVEAAKVIYTGTAREAVKKYPKNVNVAAALSLAGIGFDRTQVSIIADPAVRRNTHVITVEGDFGRMELTIENEPHPGNPRTSKLAAYSAIALLRQLAGGKRVGT